jgi:FtsH-binding integral membrane protein
MNTTATVTNKEQGLAKLTQYASVAGLLLAVVFWSYTADYQAVLRFVACAGALGVAFRTAAPPKYAWASLI